DPTAPFPYTTLFRSSRLVNSSIISFLHSPLESWESMTVTGMVYVFSSVKIIKTSFSTLHRVPSAIAHAAGSPAVRKRQSDKTARSEEHTSELQSRFD